MSDHERRLQLWPGGECVVVKGDGPDMRIKAESRDTRRWKKPTDQERRKVEIEETAERLLAHEILACQSSLVDEMLRNGQWSIEDVVNDRPYPSAWDAEECREWIKDNGHEFTPEAEDKDDELDELRDFIQSNAEANEIYEWWLVTSWMADKLKSIGQPLLDNDYGQWWGRCCTGQAMIMDGTLQRVAALIVD